MMNANTKLVRATKKVRGSESFKTCAVAVITFGILEVLVTETRLNYKFRDIAGKVSRHEALSYIERSGFDIAGYSISFK